MHKNMQLSYSLKDAVCTALELPSDAPLPPITITNISSIFTGGDCGACDYRPLDIGTHRTAPCTKEKSQSQPA